ncbi:MAG: DegV family protein [Patescibacteria group bacterium]
MSQRLRIVTDSTADLPAKLITDYGITVVPLNVHFGEEVLKDGEDIWAEEFYHRLKNEVHLPNTSQPSPAEFARVYEQLAGEADCIFSIHISEKLSGTLSSAHMAAEMVKDKVKVVVVDSQVVSMGLGLIALAAARAAAAGADSAAVEAEIKRAQAQLSLYFTVETLAHLNRTGRIGKASALLGSLLNIRPILSLADGTIIPAEKYRGSSAKANVRLLELLGEDMAGRPCWVALVHADAPAEAERLKGLIPSYLEARETHISFVGPIVGVHAGPGTIGIMALPVA